MPASLAGRAEIRRGQPKWPPVLTYLVVLLFDQSKALGPNVCRRKLPACGLYFLAAHKPKRGRPRRDSHDSECMKAARAQVASCASESKAETSSQVRFAKLRRQCTPKRAILTTVAERYCCEYCGRLLS